jgi:hypothetical protein
MGNNHWLFAVKIRFTIRVEASEFICIRDCEYINISSILSSMSVSNLSLVFEDGRCDRCNRESNVPPAHNTCVWWCIDCGARFCDSCWPLETCHGEGRTNRDGMPHERTDPRIQLVLRNVLHPSLRDDELDRLHEADEETTWFGMISTLPQIIESLLY